MRVAGIMSGTSLDGIDVAIVDIEGRGYTKKIEVVGAAAIAYPKPVREALLGVSNTMTHTATISRLHALLGELYAEAFFTTCKRRRIAPESVNLIGCHGQTIYHEGQPCEYLGRRFSNTLQIGDGSVIAERTGIDTITNFRERDIAAGGKGAPLVPYADYVLFRHNERGRIALNIGGIANLTAIPAKAKPGDIVAFDTGPGNMVIDALVRKLTFGAQTYDRGGSIAANGVIHEGLLEGMLGDRYFKLTPPKTTGREQYGAEFVTGLLATGISLVDLVATATEFTAQSIALGIQRLKGTFHDVIAAGGGCHNRLLMRRLAALLPEMSVTTTRKSGIDPDSKEAVAFAVLAYQSKLGLPGNLPSATGARHPVILGKLAQGR
ncbi:MAG TPA: anhydro-N-acetylmuramic acid kinase [Bryobacteraceae bacterium]|jgi:anhydro-N-acetylmuramic acid kinase